MFDTRRREADEFYASIIPATSSADGANVMRQALAGMLWTKQYYYYDVDQWLEEHGSTRSTRPRGCAAQSPLGPHVQRRHHLDAGQVGVPVVRGLGPRLPRDPAALVDPDFAKRQLKLMLQEHYLHPNGQLPAYEWNFGDVNPPVHAWATIFSVSPRQGADAAWATSSG